MKKSRRFLVTLICLLINVVMVLHHDAVCVTRLVRNDFWSIQSAINAASNGDTVLVDPGIYKENINLKGKGIVIGSRFITTGDSSYIRQTVIDGNRNGHVVTFSTGEKANTILCGFTITNGQAANGGGIYFSNKASPRLNNLVISGNIADSWGGGIYSDDSSPSIINVIISGNSAERFGGGIAIANFSKPVFINAVIGDNYSSGDGGGIHCYNSDPSFINVTCGRNTAVGYGGGISLYIAAHPRFMNSILWGDSPQEIFSAYSLDKYNYSAITLSYSIVQGGKGGILKNNFDLLEWLNGNQDIDPQFVGEGEIPFYLTASSPCINTGNPDTSGLQLPFYDVNNGARIRYGITDMGAYEFQGVPKVIAPVFFPLPGFYNMRQYVILSSITPGARIYYTLDGAEPTENSFLYTRPVGVTASAAIKSKGFIDRWDASDVVTGVYQIRQAAIYHVPVDFPTIQGAIDSAITGDSIIVDPGTYKENINFKGKNLVLGSQFLISGDTNYIAKTIINGGKNGTVIELNHGEDSTAMLSGLVITNGRGISGGGISCSNNSKVRLQYVVVSGNSAENGGGIACTGHSNIILEQTVVAENSASQQGGGIYCNGTVNLALMGTIITRNTAHAGGGGIWCISSNAEIISSEISENNSFSSTGAGGGFAQCDTLSLIDVLITKNISQAAGGAIYCALSNPSLTNVTITGNEGGSGGALYCINYANPGIINSILWDNKPDEIYLASDNSSSNSTTIMYSDIDGGEQGIVSNNQKVNWLEGNLNVDPAFTGLGKYPYQLSEISPCVNGGGPDTTGLNLSALDILGNQRIFNSRIRRIDMGAYEYQGEPSIRMAPAAAFKVNPRFGSLDSVYQVDASGSSDTQDSTSELDVRWDWENDGTWDTEYTKEKKATHTYNYPGRYLIKLEVKNRDGLTGTITGKTSVLAQTRTRVDADSLEIRFPFYGTAICLKFDSVQNVLGKEIIITAYGDSAPETFNPKVAFQRAVGYYTLESNQIYNVKARLLFFYTDSLLNALGMPEKNLELAFWDTGVHKWKALPTTVDATNNVASTNITHLSLWALTDKTESLISNIKDKEPNGTVTSHNLAQDSPNPFNPATTILFQIPKAGNVSLKIYNILGQEVKMLLNKKMFPGSYEVRWDGTNNFGNKVSSGIYIYRIETGTGYVDTKKMVFLK